MQRRTIAAGLVLGVPFALDLVVKSLAQQWLVYGEPWAIVPGFNLTLLFNPGVSFGLFPVGSATGLVVMMTLQAMLCFGIALYAWAQREKAIVWPLLLLLSGAIANLVDRFMNGAVTDYLDFYVGTLHWPAFNLADIWITLGVAGLIAAEYVLKPKDIQRFDKSE
jgi:signal peptidase II